MLVSAAAAATSLSLAAAADLEFVLPKLIKLYENTHSGAHLTATYGSSGALATQIESGAPFDLFFSADSSFPDELVRKGLARGEDEHQYATGQLVLFVRADSKLDLAKLGLRALEDAAIHRIAIANPRHAPYGRAAEAALHKAGLYDQVSGRLVLGESVAQAAQFVASGAAEIGLIAGSLVAADTPLAASGRAWAVPKDLYPELDQKAVVLKRASDPASARDFLKFVGHQSQLLRDSGFRGN